MRELDLLRRIAADLDEAGQADTDDLQQRIEVAELRCRASEPDALEATGIMRNGL